MSAQRWQRLGEKPASVPNSTGVFDPRHATTATPWRKGWGDALVMLDIRSGAKQNKQANVWPVPGHMISREFEE